MIILSKQLSMQEIEEINRFPNGFVKGVVDIEKELVALDADMHYELENYLKDECGSLEKDMWGFNLWLSGQTEQEILEYDSFINIHNNQLQGYLCGGMDIQDPEIEKRATEVIKQWIQL